MRRVRWREGETPLCGSSAGLPFEMCRCEWDIFPDLVGISGENDCCCVDGHTLTCGNPPTV